MTLNPKTLDPPKTRCLARGLARLASSASMHCSCACSSELLAALTRSSLVPDILQKKNNGGHVMSVLKQPHVSPAAARHLKGSASSLCSCACSDALPPMHAQLRVTPLPKPTCAHNAQPMR